MSFLQPLLDGPGKLLRRGAVEPGICRFEQRIHWRVPPAGRVTMFWQDGRGTPKNGTHTRRGHERNRRSGKVRYAP